MNSVDRSQIHPSRFRADIHSALTWQDLEGVCDRMNTACLQGKIELHIIEEMCQLISQRASEMIKFRTVMAADLIEKSPQCDCCGSSSWRDNCGQVICEICHPDPLSGLQRRQAA